MAIALNRILFPTDFSPMASSALPYAMHFASAFHAELHCLHVVDDSYLYWSAMGPEGIPVGPNVEDMLTVARTRMDTFKREHLQGTSRPVVTEVRTGRPFAEIIGYARQNRIDLIVLATHGRGAIAHVLLGSTVEKVVRKASCPVMTIRATGHEFTMP